MGSAYIINIESDITFHFVRNTISYIVSKGISADLLIKKENIV